jgi:hypothetical protein
MGVDRTGAIAKCGPQSWEEVSAMGIVVSLFMIAIGAIMRFAVSAQGTGWNVHTAGMVLLIVGIVGAVLSIVFWTSWGGLGRRAAPPAVSQAPLGDTSHDIRA